LEFGWNLAESLRLVNKSALVQQTPQDQRRHDHMSRAKLARSLAKSAFEAGETATHTSVTLAARWPILAGCFFAPSAKAMAEWNRAYAEKVAAVWEGAFAASTEWQATMMRSAFRAPSPVGLADAAARVVHKAARPARRRVKANAKRLTRAKAG
jgi:hypothetical protein